MSRYLPFQTVNFSFQTVNFSFQTVNFSFYVVLSIILDRKTDKNSVKFIVFTAFQVKILHKTINLSFLPR